MRILVTGATGMVGRNLIAALRRQRPGDQVVALVRGTSETDALEDLGVELRLGDMARVESLAKACEGIDVVYHTAALVSDWGMREQMVQINMVGLRALLESAVHFGVKRFILVSSMAVLGNRPSHDLDETAPYVVTGDNYNFTKMEAEKIARRVHREQGLPLIMLRPPYIYGPHDRNFLPRVVTAIERGKFIFIGDGMNPISLCYVGNLVDAMIHCLDSERTDARIYHLTDGEPVTRKALVNYIADELDLMRPTKHLPFWFAKGLMHAMETVANLRNAEQAPLLNTFRLKFLHTPLTFSIRRAQEELGYGPPFRFKDAMKTTLEWFKKSR